MDSKDRQIIAALQADGRMSNQELSERVNLSPSPCLRRLRQLEEAGVIRGYTALVDECAYGLPVTAFVRVRLQLHDTKTVAAFEGAVGRMDAVLDCYIMTGDADYLLRVLVEGLADYERFVRAQLHAVPGIASIETSFAFGHVKRATVFSLGVGSVGVPGRLTDRPDWALVRQRKRHWWRIREPGGVGDVGRFSAWSVAVSLRPPQPIPPVPDDTARVARAALRTCNPYLILRDRLGTLFTDADFADLFPKRGQPAYAPWRLALVTLMQFREGLSDRQAAEAVRARIDWKYLLALDLDDPGFDRSVLCEFRGRLLGNAAVDRLLARVLDAAREDGLLKARGRQRTDSTHVLAAIRTLNRLELAAETLRAALNDIAVVAPDWLRALAPPDWHERYDQRIEERRIPEVGSKRDAYVATVGADGFRLLDALARTDAPPDAAALPAIGTLRRVWARHFERIEDGQDGGGPGRGARLRSVRGRGPGDRLESPYDTEARFRTKASTTWTGYMVHFTESCDPGAPRLVVHADTTPANVHEAPRTAPIHAALADKGLAPSEHLVDSAYVSADHLITAREQHGIDLVGPTRQNLSWQSHTEGAFSAADFTVDWDRQKVRCPEGKESTGWYRDVKRPGQRAQVRAQFRAADCKGCASRSRCTRTQSPNQGRVVAVLPRQEHDALAAARAREGTVEGKRLYAQRQGIESTLSQAVRAFGLRRTRYRGLAKTGLQHVATAAAINLDRIAAWFGGRPIAPTRTSRFAALAA